MRLVSTLLILLVGAAAYAQQTPVVRVEMTPDTVQIGE